MMIDAFLLIWIVGMVVAGLAARFTDWGFGGLTGGGLISMIGGGFTGYLKVVQMYPEWFAANPSLSPWEGAMWITGGAVGVILAAVCTMCVGWPRRP